MALEFGEPALEAKDGNPYLPPGGGGGVWLQGEDGEVSGDANLEEPLPLKWVPFEEVVRVGCKMLSHICFGSGGEGV